MVPSEHRPEGDGRPGSGDRTSRNFLRHRESQRVTERPPCITTQHLVEELVEHVRVVESSSAIPVVSTEDDNFDPRLLADGALAVLPRPLLECTAIRA